ncbi:MAG: hypothetical protein ACPGXZ_03970, partial [Saprospiraceae bacterium]
MEDWQKYIFDPKNPKGFKAYNLLKKIIKEGNTLLLTDMYYFNELYKNEIWTKDVIDELWDKPDNFEELSANEKVEVYINNFSDSSYLELLEKKVDKFAQLKQNKLFSKLSVDLKEHWEDEVGDPFAGVYLDHYSLNSSLLLSIKNLMDFDKNKRDLSQKVSYQKDSNCFIFFKNRKGAQLKLFLRNLRLTKLSVFFIDEFMFDALELGSEKFKNLHPIILKEDE